MNLSAPEVVQSPNPIDRRTTRMTQAVAPAIPAGVDPRTRTQIVAAVLLGLFLAALDQTVVGTALPKIVTDLNGNDIYTWAFTSYILTATISGAIYGLSSVIGPAIGGIITDTVGWHWVFFVNLPLGAIVFTVIWRALPTFRPAGERPKIDYLGASVLAAALVPLLIGLTNKQSGNWGDPAVGGLIVLGLVIAAVFVFVESRASEPLVPLSLFRNRSFTISVIAMFAASMAFFAPIVFLPRWFQVVGGSSATQSGYQLLALLGGLIISAMGSGQIVARTGRYKLLAVGAAITLGVGLFLLSNLRADTPLPVLFLWMFITGLGVGPMFSIFTLVVQGAVAPRQIGTATSSLTLFQQLGGSVGLAIAGTIFGSRLVEELPRQLSSSVPPQVSAGFAGGGSSAVLGQLTGVGDLGQA